MPSKSKGLFTGLRQWVAKILSPDMQAWLTGMDIPDSDKGAEMTSPYQQSAWIYIAVSVLAESIANIPFRISTVDKKEKQRISSARNGPEYKRRALWENIVESGEVVDLFDRPHPTMDRQLFWEQLVSWMCLRGEFFVLPLDADNQPIDLGDRAPVINQMLTLNPDLFWHVVHGYELVAWRYTGSPLMSPVESHMLNPREVIHSRSVNPYLYWRGMSPLLVAMLPAKSDYAAEMFMKGLLLNNADTGIIATTDQNLTAEQREQFSVALRERKRKAGTPDRPLFLSSGVKIEKPSISNVDMQFLETRHLLRQEIGAILKVPESLMGFSQAKTSALSGGGNAMNEEKLTFTEQVLSAHCHRIEAAMQPIVKSFGENLVGWFDIEGLPIMQEARRSRLSSATTLFGMGYPVNIINRVYDLGFPDLPWGDVGYLPFNLQRAEDAAKEPDLPPDEGPPPGDSKPPKEPVSAALGMLAAMRNGSNGQAVEIRRKPSASGLWTRLQNQRKATVKLFESKTSRVLRDYRAKTLAKLDHIHLEDGYVDEAPIFGARKSMVDLIFNAAEFGNSLRVTLTSPMRTTLQDAGEELRQEIGLTDPWEYPPKAVLQFLEKRTQPIMGTGETVRGQLNTALDEGITAGETHQQLSDRIRSVFNRLVNGDGLTESEARRIARTETHVAYETARHEAMVDSGIEYKSWLTSHGPNVRDGHEAAEEDYIDNPIPVDEPFKVTDDHSEVEELMMFPGDDSMGASLSNIINCFPAETLVEMPGLLGATRHWYEGDLVELRFASGRKLSATPNHPIARANGKFDAIHKIAEGDYCIRCASGWGLSAAPDINRAPSKIGDVYRSAQIVGVTERKAASPPDLHGDTTDGHIEVVTVKRSLTADVLAASDEQVKQFGLALANLARPLLAHRHANLVSSGTSDKDFGRGYASGGIGLSGDETILFGSSGSSVATIDLDRPSDWNASRDKSASDYSTVNAVSLGDLVHTFAGGVSLDNVVSVKRFHFVGYVFNLDTGKGYYTANGIATRNCQCVLLAAEKTSEQEGLTTYNVFGYGRMQVKTNERETA